VVFSTRLTVQWSSSVKNTIEKVV